MTYIMRYLYTVLFYLALPFIVLRLFWKSRKNPAYRQRIPERFAYSLKAVTAGSIWVHAVSVGEVLAAAPLIKKIKQQYPMTPLLVTTMTPTGAERVKAIFGDAVCHIYVPYDVPGILQRFLQKMQPRLLVLVETELWPNLLHVCSQQKLPVLVVNARLSAKSAAGYRRLGNFTRSLLNNITLIAAQNAEDGERFIELGLPRERLRVTGSIKFDLELPGDLTARANLLRQQWSGERPVWIAASTHESEEEIILNAFQRIRKQMPTLLLIIVPRHPERFTKVADLCGKYSEQIVLRSKQIACTSATEIFLGDSMGELLLFYASADIAFVGGSLVKTGGHNPLEPAALGLPVLTGPHMFNFAVIEKQLKEAGALITVQNSEEIAAQVMNTLQDRKKYQQMRNAGLRVIEQNRGALIKQLALVYSLLNR